MRLTDERRNAIVEEAARVFGPGAHLRLHDPAALPAARELLQGQDVDFYDDPYALAHGADALVLATPWPEYRELDLKRIAERMRQPVLVDARNFWNADVAGKAGARYVGVGYGAAG
ncbi:MAG: UDP binding domain-containing protein [Porticoccaceae bacterium]